MAKRLDNRPRRRGWVALFVVTTLVILTVGYAYYTHETERVRRQKYDEISAIAKLKTGSIQEWRKELLLDVRALSKRPFVKRTVNEWFRDPNNDALLTDLRDRFVAGQQQGGYADALLLDLDGNIILSASGKPGSMNAMEKKAIEEAVSSRLPVLTDMYRTPHGAILMDGVAPILDPSGQPIAVGLYRANPDSALFPLIQTWPTPSKTAETLLVRRDGEDVLFLNDLRHRANTALSLRQPLALHDLPAAQAVSGKTGLFQGKDYRGVDVLADLRPIPDSPWFMVAKVDTNEILAEANYRGSVIIIFSGLFIFIAAGLTAYGYRNRQARLYENLYQSERERRKAEELFRTTLYSIGDAVITTDTRGLVQQMNPVAERLTGWPEPEATAKSLDEVYRIVGEESRTPAQNPVQRVLAEGVVVGLANHTILISRDGTERHIVDSGAPIRSEDDSILGVVLVFRDQTEQLNTLKALRESEERYRTVADFTYNWEYWASPEGKLFYISPSCERITGYSAKEFIDDPQLMNRIIHPDDLTKMLDHYHKVRTVTPHALDKMDFRIIRRDGETRWLGHVCQPVYSQEGQSLGRRVSNRDITERKLLEESLQSEKDKLKGILHSMNDGVYVVNTQNEIEYVNPVIEASFGAVSGRKCYEYFHDRVEPCPWCKNQEVFAGESVHWEWYSHKTGQTYELFDTPIRNADGSISKLEIFHDVTDRKRAEEVQVLLSTAIDQAAEAVIITDSDGVIQYVNPAQEIISGHSREKLLGQTPNIFKSDEYSETFHRNLWDTINAGNVWSGRFINRKQDGTECHEDVSISPVYDNSGNLTNFVAVKSDITKQVELQKQFHQAQKMEAIGTLAGGIAHDFNNLLQAITGYTELLMMSKKQGDPELHDLQRIYDSTQRGADLVKSLMMFSRKTKPELHPVDLNREIVEVQKLLFNTIPKTIKIDLRLSGKLETVHADASQIAQVLMNLGVNARDAMPDGGTLTIETTSVQLDRDYCAVQPEVKPGLYVLLAVSDSGQGMDENTLEHIFDPFFTTKEVGKGTGLGLATVYGIVKEHKGHITCYSEPGHGTTFNIYLPAIQTEKTSETQTEDAPIQRGTETILLVEDEESLRIMGSRHLKQYGYHVITASNGREALDIYQKEGKSISLIILDLIMPVMDGGKCLEEILRINPNAKVIIASGVTEEGSANVIQVKGAKGSIKKPYDIRQLLRTIREVLDNTLLGANF